MAWLLKLLPMKGWLALLAGAALTGSLWFYGAKREATGFRAGQAEVTARWTAADLKRAEVAARAREAAQAEEQRRFAAHQEVLDALQADLTRARADAAIADAAAGRLRQRVNALIAAARSGAAGANPAAGPAGPPADDAAGVLADVLGRCVARVRLLAELADQRGAAGAACERAYDALTPDLASTRYSDTAGP